MDDQSGRDLLSDLPVGIIEIILVLLPIRDAIRTSILSSKWRFRWPTIPHLVFHDNKIYSDEKSIDQRRVKKFVTCTLFRHKGPLHTFKLYALEVDNCPESDQWLLSLPREEIKELVLCFGNGQYVGFKVPSYLYSFRNLTILKLVRCYFGPLPPTFKGFLYLRSLIIQYTDVASGTIESIVASSPLLENLECTYICGCYEVIISAPFLKHFSLSCMTPEIYLYAPLLTKISLKLNWEHYEPEERTSVCKLLGGVTNLESLAGDEFFTEYLSKEVDFWQHPLALPHLKIMRLSRVNSTDIDEILVVVRLIMDATNLRELQVDISTYVKDDEDMSTVPSVHIWDSKCPQNCTFENLKVIKVSWFSGGLYEMKFIKFLLESSPVLEKMIIEPDRYPSNTLLILNSIVELLSYSRASTNAKILFSKWWETVGDFTE